MDSEKKKIEDTLWFFNNIPSEDDKRRLFMFFKEMAAKQQIPEVQPLSRKVRDSKGPSLDETKKKVVTAAIGRSLSIK